MRLQRTGSWMLAAALCFAVPAMLAAQDEPNLSKEEMKQFLLNAKVVNSKHTSKGITAPWRLTLNDGKLTHDASWQSIDEHKSMVEKAGGVTEIGFVDSYKYNIAGYILAEMLGMDDVVPVTVERKWQGTTGSLSWWLKVRMDEMDRLKQKIQPPDPDAWNKQIFRIRVFAELIYDTDINQTNILIDENWKAYRIDFSRAFRTHKDLQNAGNLVRCPRDLLEKLKKLDAKEFEEKSKRWLSKSEIQAVMARRDKIVAQFEKMIAAKGEAEILY